jgi:hypothetical protein
MKIIIMYDNQAKKGLKAGWGFSCLIENILNSLGEYPWAALLKSHNGIQIDRFRPPCVNLKASQ